MKVLIIGAGLFGCSIAEELAKKKYQVTLIDREKDIMQRASKSNHNRLHFGFHYPRSVETAVQSVDGLLSFFICYKDAIVSEFPNHYAIAKEGSKVTPNEFQDFCKEVGLFYSEELPDEKLINHDFISTSFKVNEPIFDYKILKKITHSRLSKYSNIDLKLQTLFSSSMISEYDFIINASYEGINDIHKKVGVSPIPLKLQDVIIPVLEIDFPRTGLTIMDGPFGSIMPKGFEKNKFLLYHVTESVLEQSFDGSISGKNEVNFEDFIRKSTQMYPILDKSKVIGSWRTIRALPINKNDARVSEVFLFDEKPNFITVLSGKIATCRKLAMEIAIYLETGKLHNNIQA